MNDPRLTVYIITIKPFKNVESSNRNLLKHIINDFSEGLKDSYILMEFFKKIVNTLDQQKMYSDEKIGKSMTAIQLDLEDENVNPDLRIHTDKHVIEGELEGGKFGRIRNRRSTSNKKDNSPVKKEDAITDKFYFLLYVPLEHNKLVLMVHSYSDESIDGIIRHFFQNLFKKEKVFNAPKIDRYVPPSIIQDFKNSAAVSGLSFSTEVPSKTLLEKSVKAVNKHYKVEVKITPIDQPLSMDEFDNAKSPLQNTSVGGLILANFRRRVGILQDSKTNKTSPFALDSSFDIKPVIPLSKYLTFGTDDEKNFKLIKDYCFKLLKVIKSEIYPTDEVQER
jgi:hypothetical protein